MLSVLSVTNSQYLRKLRKSSILPNGYFIQGGHSTEVFIEMVLRFGLSAFQVVIVA